VTLFYFILALRPVSVYKIIAAYRYFMTDNEKITLRTQLSSVFRPSAPIDKHALFAGRKPQIDLLMGAILQTGQHAILYGERGIGKTSLARVLAEVLATAGYRTVHSDTLNCDSTDDFSTLWHRALRELTVKMRTSSGRPNPLAAAREEVKEADGLLPKIVSPDDVRRALSTFAGRGAVIIFDEFDRITNKQAKTLMADTIKNLSDHAIDSTLLIVGVAKSVAELISEHRSVDRAIVEVPMPRLSPEELSQIVRKGFANLKLTISDQVHREITFLSHGLPHYTHLLALEAGKSAIDRGSSVIEGQDLTAALSQVVKSKHSVANEYHAAVCSAQKSSKHMMILLACALAKRDYQGYFQASDAAATMAALWGGDQSASIIPRRLEDFTTAKRGSVLEREGAMRQFKYRFSNPLLQPYAIISSLSEGLITDQQVRALQREPENPPEVATLNRLSRPEVSPLAPVPFLPAASGVS
jgi:DNA polymerase III delta prime subunit